MKVKDILMMVKIYLTYDENYLSIGERYLTEKRIFHLQWKISHLLGLMVKIRYLIHDKGYMYVRRLINISVFVNDILLILSFITLC